VLQCKTIYKLHVKIWVKNLVNSPAVKPAFLKLRPVQSLIENDQLSMSNGKSEAQKSYSDALLRLSAVINEGKMTVALTEVTSAKKQNCCMCEHGSLAC
jgi:hypothetical protein